LVQTGFCKEPGKTGQEKTGLPKVSKIVFLALCRKNTQKTLFSGENSIIH
jgi:hypothetical protein